jgi:glutamyl-tRNA reductase
VSVVVIGVNHRTSPLPLLERVAINGEQVVKTLHDVCSKPNISEAVIVSTCNRIEIYAVAERFHGAYSDIRDVLCTLGGLAPEDLHPHLYSQHDEAAVGHLFEVAAGLDSAVIGESEILGQVRTAWELSRAEGGAKATLNLLFRHALEVGKRARTETAIGRGTASVSHAAVEMATDLLSGLEGRRVLVVGAGEMAEGVAVALRAAGVGEIAVTNRTFERAVGLAARVDGRVHPFSDLSAALVEADVVVTCTGAGSLVIDTDTVEMGLAARAGRPLLVVDIAVPRDVDPGVGELPMVTLLNLDDLRAWAQRGLEARAAEAQKVRHIVEDELERHLADAAARQAAPLLSALRSKADDIRRAELERFQAKLADLSPAQREAVEALTAAIVNKMLHEPSVRLKDEAGSPRGERYASAVRELFDLQ